MLKSKINFGLREILSSKDIINFINKKVKLVKKEVEKEVEKEVVKEKELEGYLEVKVFEILTGLTRFI